MARTLITNISLGPLTMPAPFAFVLPPGKSDVIADTPDNVLAVLGGAKAVEGVVALEQLSDSPAATRAAGVALIGTLNGITYLTGAADPTAGAGVAAVRPAVYIRTGTDQIYLKTGAGDTAWSLTPFTASPTFTGLVTMSQLTATSAVNFNGQVLFTGANALCRIDCGETRETVLQAATLTGNVLAWDPGGGSGVNLYKYSDIYVTNDADANRTIQTMVKPTQGYRLRVRIWNKNTAAARTVTLLHDDGATGTATERFFVAGLANKVIPAGGYAEIYNDNIVSNRWSVG